MPRHLDIDADALAALCQRHHIRRLALFGSVLGADFHAGSDVDVLVEFKQGHVPGFAFIELQDQLTELLGRQVDLHTPGSLSRYFRDEVMQQAEVQYAA